MSARGVARQVPLGAGVALAFGAGVVTFAVVAVTLAAAIPLAGDGRG